MGAGLSSVIADVFWKSSKKTEWVGYVGIRNIVADKPPSEFVNINAERASVAWGARRWVKTMNVLTLLAEYGKGTGTKVNDDTAFGAAQSVDDEVTHGGPT